MNNTKYWKASSEGQIFQAARVNIHAVQSIFQEKKYTILQNISSVWQIGKIWKEYAYNLLTTSVKKISKNISTTKIR